MLAVMILKRVGDPLQHVHLSAGQVDVLRGEPREVQAPSLAEIRDRIILEEVWRRHAARQDEGARGDENTRDFEIQSPAGEDEICLSQSEKPGTRGKGLAELLEV